MMRLKIVFPILVLLTCSCATPPPASDAVSVVTTTNLLADLTATIGGDCVSVTSLMGPGVDPHLYKASAGDVDALSTADVIVYNGLHLEAAMGQVFEELEGTNVICIQDGLTAAALIVPDPTLPQCYDPHIWFDVSLWQEAATYVSQQLSIIDPDNLAIYTANLEGYLEELSALESYIEAQVATIPKSQRVVITAHDAFGYFGKAYGLEVLGIQGISTATEASTGDISALATQIALEKIPAIFVESSVSSRTIEALQAAVEAKGFAVTIGGSLYADSLGDQASGHHTYCAMVRYNVDTMVAGLTQ